MYLVVHCPIDGRTRLHILQHPGICTDNTMVANGDSPKHSGIGIYYYIILNNGVTCYTFNRITLIIQWKALGPKCDALIQFYVIANDTSLSDNDARAVVDGKIFANRRTWMDVYACLRVRHLCQHARNERHFHLEKLMSNAVIGERFNHGVARNNLCSALGCGVTIESCRHIGAKNSTQFGEFFDK